MQFNICCERSILECLEFEEAETLDAHWFEIIHPDSLYRPLFDSVIKWDRSWETIERLKKDEIKINLQEIWNQFRGEMLSFHHLLDAA